MLRDDLPDERVENNPGYAAELRDRESVVAQPGLARELEPDNAGIEQLTVLG